MDFHEYLLTQSQTELASILQLPFIDGLRSGELSQISRDYYVAQDEYYVARFMDLSLQVEQLLPPNLRSSIVADTNEGDAHLGLAPSNRFKQIEIANHNLAYLAHIEDIVSSGDPLQGLLALLPCTESYHLIGKALLNDHSSERYSTWMKYYVADAYQAGVQWIWQTIDQLVPSFKQIDSDVLASYEAIYQKSYAFEYDFWAHAFLKE